MLNISRLSRGLTAATLVLLVACSSEEQPADIAVEQAWARETVAGQTSTAAYMTIMNRGSGQDRLIAASSPLASDASLHSSSSEGGIARMRPLQDGIVIPANGSVQFKPGGDHVMLTGVSQHLKPGTSLQLRLRFERSGERQVEIGIVDAATGGSTTAQSHSGH